MKTISNLVLLLLFLVPRIGTGTPPGRRPPRDAAERQALREELPTAPSCAESPSSQGHFGSPKQASTWMRGPEPGELEVQILDLDQAFNRRMGTSPWLVASTRRYRNAPEAVTLWAATLTDVYRVVVDGPRFEALGRFTLNRFPTSLTWNLFATDDGQVFIPDTDGAGRLRRGGASGPTLRVLGDDADGSGRLGPSIRLLRTVELEEEELRRVCAPPAEAKMVQGHTGSNFRPGFQGETVTVAVFERPGGDVLSYLVALDEEFHPLAAAEIGPTSPSNDFPAEPDGPDRTAYYVATDQAIVKMVFDAARGTMERRWTVPLPVRGRLGTTPTLMNTPDGGRFVIAVDARAAVVAGFNGLIAQSPDTRPGALIAVRREDDTRGRPRVITTELPLWLGAVENSPAVRGGVAVIANYTGYLPEGLVVPPGGRAPRARPASWGRSPDARTDFATGVLAVTYHPGTDAFDILWERPDLQFSGIPAISAASNLVYGTGAERENGQTWFYGLRLHRNADGPGGELLIRESLGKAPFRTPRTNRQGQIYFSREDYRLEEGEFFDAGNSLLLLEDGSAIVNGGRSLARIRNPPH